MLNTGSHTVSRTVEFLLPLSAFVLVCACRSIDATAQDQADPYSTKAVDAAARTLGFAGTWDTTFGSMTLASFGDRLSGTYGHGGQTNTISGRRDGSRFEFTYREPSETGEGWFEIADDGSAFRGQWRADGSDAWSDWDGRRSLEGHAVLGFAGVWDTSYGRMRLAQDGADVRGTYTYAAGSTIEGIVDGRILRAVYTEPDGTRGRALFELSEEGSFLNGIWRADADASLAFEDDDVGAWNGTRVLPVPGRVWLVVLEAHWEGSLAEPEYSFGAMLRSFFSRLPNVQVRQRFFHDEADFVRVCSELDVLVEPVVLYVSSHGVPQGVLAGSDLIDGATIGKALRGVESLELLHLGGCATLGGDLGAQIRAASDASADFAISGFGVPVDWAGSAIVDFTYLDLVLGRGMPPAEAVRAVRSMITFAGPPGADETPIEGTDLGIFEPKE